MSDVVELRRSREVLLPMLRLSDLTPAERADWGEALLQDMADREPETVARCIRTMYADMAANGYLDGMGEAEVRAAMQEVADVLGVSLGRSAH